MNCKKSHGKLSLVLCMVCIWIAGLMVPDALVAQTTQNVTGQVLDEREEPLAGCVISVKGQKVNVITDINGNFSIKASNQDVLEVSFLGYEKQSIPVSGKKVFRIIMKEDAQALDEVVVTGYQTLSKERVTGAFGLISSKQFENKLQPDLKSLLEGQAAGVVLDKDGNIEIRGVSTFSAETTPLLVVDGFPVEGTLDDLNPDNIENITVLKDGVAASIYGSRAANGVIVITTKQGQQGKTRISYKGSFNVTLKPDLSKLNRASTSDYIDAELDLFNLNPNAPSTMDTDNMSRVTYLMMQVREGNITQAQADAEINQLRQIDGLKQAEKYMFRNKLSHQHNVSISGGSETNLYNAAVNYTKERGNFINTDNDRLILDLNNRWKPFKFLTVETNVNMVYARSNEPTYGYEDLLGYNSSSDLQPYTNIVDAYGNPCDVWGISQYKVNRYQTISGMKDWTYSPLEDTPKDMQRTTDWKTRIGGKLRFDIIPGLNLEVGGNWQRGNNHYRQLRQRDAYAVRITYNDATSESNPANHYFPDGAVINEQRNYSEDWTVRTQLNFNRAFNGEKHRVSFLVGNEVRRSTRDYNTLATRAGFNETAGSFIPVNIKDYEGGVYDSDMLFGRGWKVDFTNGEYLYTDNRFVSWYGNGSYEFDNRFIVSGSVRLDLTNFFGTDPKYRYKPFWSVGGTYKLGDEKFFQVPWIDRLNIRASYGINGNIKLDQGPFLILSTGNYNQTTGGVSYGIASPPNNQLRWEKTKTFNVGVDLSVLKNRLNFTVDYYTKNSSDLLANDAIDNTTGFTSIMRNVGRMSNSGIEVSINSTPVMTRDFRWNLVYNFAYNYNKVKDYNVSRKYATSYTTAKGILVEGYPADGLWGFRFAGLSDTGETQIYNAAGEVILPGNATPEDVVYLGTFRPKFDMSLTNSFSYKNWDLSFMLIAKLGHKYRKDCFSGSNYQNRHVAERWRKPGDEEHTIYPVLKSWNMDMFYFPYIDEMVGNASYMKLRDVTLSYSFDPELTRKIGMSNARVYFQMRNLLTVTAKDCDIDPETAEINESGGTGASTEQGFTSLPLRPEFYVGLSFSF